MAQQLVLEAVRNESSISTQGILQRLFAAWFDAFVYNQIWEDPRVDIEALAIDEDSRILTISSGGCNALNYLLEGPQSVTAVDLNRHHIYLLELKAVAARYLPGQESFFAFFGRGKGPRTGSDYLKYIAPHLSREARIFWESNTLLGSLAFGDRISFFRNAGLYEHSRNGYFLRFFHWLSRRLGCDPKAVLAATSIEEQERLFEEKIGPFFESSLIKLIGRLPVTLFGLGIPPQQYEELKKDQVEGGSIIDIYRERAHRLACGFPIDENYFAWQAFGRRYDTENRKALPEYLKEENFETLRANIGRLSPKVIAATVEIRKNASGTYNRFVFLDAQDWMNAEQMTELWTAIAERAEPGARIIFRTAGAASPLEEALPPELLGRFEYHRELSAELFKQDRASIYGGFHLYELK
ncbi:MAG: BtaA family protein [Acidobacteria bacterium]|nr:BtaA family protein [Acidobacteriota bacterium]